MTVAYAAETNARLTGRAPFTTLDGIRMADHHMFFTAAKAERDLGFRARPYREALEDAIGWFEAAGYLNGKRGRQRRQVGVSAERVARSTLRRRAQSGSHSAANSSA